MSERMKSIALKQDTYSELVSMGYKNESFDKLVKRLMAGNQGVMN